MVNATAELGQRRPALRPVDPPRRDTAAQHAYDGDAAQAGKTAIDLEGHDRLRRGCAVHGVVLLARPDHGRRRRHPEAGHHRAGSGHPRRGRPAREPRPGLRPLQRHVDVEPAHHRARRAHAPGASGLVADDDQVGAHDDRLPGSRLRRRSTGAPVTSTRTRRPTRASCSTATSTTGSASSRARTSSPATSRRSTRPTSTRRRSRSATWPAHRPCSRTAISVGSKSETYTFSTTGLPGSRRPRPYRRSPPRPARARRGR